MSPTSPQREKNRTDVEAATLLKDCKLYEPFSSANRTQMAVSCKAAVIVGFIAVGAGLLLLTSQSSGQTFVTLSNLLGAEPDSITDALHEHSFIYQGKFVDIFSVTGGQTEGLETVRKAVIGLLTEACQLEHAMASSFSLKMFSTHRKDEDGCCL